jgi:hypothetical protein
MQRSACSSAQDVKIQYLMQCGISGDRGKSAAENAYHQQPQFKLKWRCSRASKRCMHLRLTSNRGAAPHPQSCPHATLSTARCALSYLTE